MSLINSTAIPSGASAYEIDQSLRFDDGRTTHLTRTPSSTSNRKTFTFSTWFKPSLNENNRNIFVAGNDYDNYFNIFLRGDDRFQLGNLTAAGGDKYWQTATQYFRDPSAWYHLVVTVDTTNGTAANRIKLWINGTQFTLTASSAGQYGSSEDTYVNLSGTQNTIGRAHTGSAVYDGYLAEVNFIDGAAKVPADFGETGDYGEWKPIEYSGTYGTNGFYLSFAGGGVISSATGGNSTGTTGNYKYTTYTSSGTFTPSNSGYVEYLVVGGGGGGGLGLGGGGGAGGFKTGFVQLTGSTAYTVTVGAGGAYDTSGSDSSISGTGITTLTATGGGRGGGSNDPATGGSGGGGRGIGSGSIITGASGTSGQGNAGGNGVGADGFPAGGGGGAGAVGANGVGSGSGGDGGVGLQSNIDTNNYYYAAGGGGGAHFSPSTTGGDGGTGGAGGGARGGGSAGSGGGSARNAGSAGGTGDGGVGGAAGANTGSGGGGGAWGGGNGGAGGSGIVIIRYKFQ